PFDITDLTGQVRKQGDYAFTGGAFGDIWKCLWLKDAEDVGPEIVRLRPQTGILYSSLVDQRFDREVGIWHQLDHKNILPLYGLVNGFGFYPAMICPWAANGALSDYLERRHQTLSMEDKFRLVSVLSWRSNTCTTKLLTVVYWRNILIHYDGRACLADFGLSTALKAIWGSAYFTESVKGSFRWAAPEVFQACDDGHADLPNPKCDVYSFGSIILQVLSGKVPYFYLRSDTQVLGMVVRGIEPERPKIPHIENRHWDIIQWCWTANGENRPPMSEVAQLMRSEANRLQFMFASWKNRGTNLVPPATGSAA
ncbi:hypothetical protein HYDPIDRAFT_85639, partial [Hydnomerulius pinastri MD-312]